MDQAQPIEEARRGLRGQKRPIALIADRDFLFLFRSPAFRSMDREHPAIPDLPPPFANRREIPRDRGGGGEGRGRDERGA